MARAEAALVPLYDVLAGSGGGWIEEWMPEDPDSGTPEETVLVQGAWCHGYTIRTDGSTSSPEAVVRDYGKRYGCRIWKEWPTARQREGTPWVTEEGTDVYGRVSRDEE